MQSSTQVHREALQRQTQQDWANREYIELVSNQQNLSESGIREYSYLDIVAELSVFPHKADDNI